METIGDSRGLLESLQGSFGKIWGHLGKICGDRQESWRSVGLLDGTTFLCEGKVGVKISQPFEFDCDSGYVPRSTLPSPPSSEPGLGQAIPILVTAIAGFSSLQLALLRISNGCLDDHTVVIFRRALKKTTNVYKPPQGISDLSSHCYFISNCLQCLPTDPCRQARKPSFETFETTNATQEFQERP